MQTKYSTRKICMVRLKQPEIKECSSEKAKDCVFTREIYDYNIRRLLPQEFRDDAEAPNPLLRNNIPRNASSRKTRFGVSPKPSRRQKELCIQRWVGLARCRAGSCFWLWAPPETHSPAAKIRILCPTPNRSRHFIAQSDSMPCIDRAG